MSPKELIDDLFQQKARNDSNSQDLANSLNILAKTVFGNVNRFIFELLQNADDAPNSKNVPVQVDFLLFDEYLLFRHNGAQFKPDDIIGISRVGSRESGKDKDIEKTGYKGIGFKSVFGTSDCVQIVSNDYSFRFDKFYSTWINRSDYPWQVIPIWTEEIPDEVKTSIDDNFVNTIIKIGNSASIKSEIENVFKDCTIMLFLRHIGCVRFYDKGSLTLSIEKRQIQTESLGLFRNNNLLSTWLIKDFVIPVDESLREKLRRLSEQECPQKLREAKTAKITFAALVKEEQLAKAPSALMYCYLPTTVSKGFPYIINGDFITNAERTMFLENDWNAFLFENIALKQFEWIQELHTSGYKYQFTKLIKNRFSKLSTSGIEKAFNKGFDQAISSIAFIPEDKSKKLLKINECIVDTTLYCQAFGSSLIKDYLKTTAGIIDFQIENPGDLISIGAKEFGFEDLFNFFGSDTFKNNNGLSSAENIKTIQFLFNHSKKEKNSNWLDELKQKKILLNTQLELKIAKEIFFPSADSKNAYGLNALNFLNGEVYKHFAGTSEVTEWLRNLGVKEPSDVEIVRKSIIPLIHSDKINESNAIEIGRFVFKVFKSGKFTDSDYKDLERMKFSTNRGMQLAENSYLSDEFGPELKIASIVPDANFISPLYSENAVDLPKWKEFLSDKLKVRQRIGIRLESNAIERVQFKRKYPQFASFFSYLDTNNLYSPITKTWSEGYQQHYIVNFTFIDFLEYTNQPKFAKLFWKLMLSNWQQVHEACKKTVYKHKQGSESVPSYLQYYVRNFQSIPATDGKCYKTTDIYIPALRNLIGNFFPVADIEHQFTKEQAEFLGLKRKITISDCIVILKSIEAKHVSPELLKQISALYEEILNSKTEFDSKQTAELQKWIKEGKLLALNNTFRPIQQLSCFAVETLSAPVNSEYFIKLFSDLTLEKTIALSKLFSIPVITYDQLEFAPVKPVEENTLLEIIRSKLSFISIVFSHHTSEGIDKVKQRLVNRLADTKFHTAESLSLVYHKNDIEIYNSKMEAWYNERKEFYYAGKWNSPLTLYSLSTSLCSLLEIQGIERELALLLQLNQKDAFAWLKEKGYKFDEQTMAIPDVETIGEPALEYDSPTEQQQVVVETFTPDVKAEDIDVTQVITEKRLAKTVFSQNTENTHGVIRDEQTKKDVGRWCEICVFAKLKTTPNIENITWVNELKESYKPYDFEITEKGQKRYLEVKGTPSPSKEIAYFTPSEWKFMFEQGPNYSIYRVFNAGKQTDVRIDIVDNPIEQIKVGNFIPNPIALEL